MQLALTVAAVLMATPVLGQDAPSAYRNNCLVCHQAAGKGLPGQFPRLSGRASHIAASPEGRKYLVDVVLNGVSGRITVDGRNIMGVMPSYAGLPDADLAQVLTYVSRLDAAGTPPPPFTPAEIKAARGARLTSAQVATGRARLVDAKVIP